MFKSFQFKVAFRVMLLGGVMFLLVFMAARQNMFFAAGLMALIVLGQLVELYYFISRTNRKLTTFLESVKYQDFISTFATDNKLEL